MYSQSNAHEKSFKAYKENRVETGIPKYWQNRKPLVIELPHLEKATANRKMS
jgi:hypothetical protein